MAPRRTPTLARVVALVLLPGCGPSTPGQQDHPPPDSAEREVTFTAVQPELFSASGAQPNAFVDFDGDGDLDLAVGFRDRPNRLYRNDDGAFTDVAALLGLALPEDTRAMAWGDYDGDGDPDVYIGFPSEVGERDRLYRNDGTSGFTDVSGSVGLDVSGTTRQVSWIDVDGDGDLDLFVALRDRANRLFRNDGGRFVDITEQSAIGDTRRTVGAVWFDYDVDGDLDVFVANQNGDHDGLWRNEGGRFSDVAPALGIHGGDRPEANGGVGPAVTDYDNDGDLDLFVASYGPDVLWRNNGDGTFTDAVRGEPAGADHHSVTAAWGDADNDGWEDLYVSGFLGTEPEAPDHLFGNAQGRLVDLTPEIVRAAGASHGVRWADFDQDGDLDLALANNAAAGGHWLYRNELPAPRRRSVQVDVRDDTGRATFAGSEVRLFDATDDRLLGTRLIDSGGGYCSQGRAPVYFGIPASVRSATVVVTIVDGRTRRDVRHGPFDIEPGATSLTVRVSPGSGPP